MVDYKTDVPGIYKSSEGFLINKDNNALKAYKNRKKKEQTVLVLEKEVTELKSDIKEIKELLKGLIK